YNGKSFDIPYLMKRFLYFFEENPFNEDTDSLGDKVNSRFHHVDLYHNCRRIYKDQFAKYTLSQVEAELLGFMRPNELPGSLIAECYRLYQSDPRKYVGLIKKIIEHNYWDVYSMPLILQTLLEI
ncbi:MAG: ribonuclease H-like domain-containing protein, partial [Promethearchaeota archaeon]